LREVAGRFSEEDLTRYLQLTLDLYKDLQTSLQPRLHLEVGLLRLVHAGRLMPIEQALSALSSGAPLPKPKAAPIAPPPLVAPPVAPPERKGPSPFERDLAAKRAEPVKPADAPPWKTDPPKAVAGPVDSDARTRLINTLQEMDRPFVVDNIELASVSEAGPELILTAPKEVCTMLRFSEGEIAEASQKAFGRALRIKIVEGAAAAPPVQAAPRRSANEEELMQRAMSDPGVQSFREAFPGAEVRQVRNLKE
jgi:DNA polymerase-3 subunit gamma/tau